MKNQQFTPLLRTTWNRYTFIIATILLGNIGALNAQIIQQPSWWFGISAAGNANFYSGTTQTLNGKIKAQSAFHEGFGIRPYASLLAEYRPTSIWGLMLHVGYDGRGGNFEQVMAPCNCASDLKANLSYISIEPSLRFTPFSKGLFVYVGASANFALNHSFEFSQEKRADGALRNTEGDFSEMNNHVFGTQIGLGYDMPIQFGNRSTHKSISPFISFHPYFGRAPRAMESWSLTTVRVGVAFKFGRVSNATLPASVEVLPMPMPANDDVDFTVSTPLVIPVKRRINETFPLRNYVFFETGSSKIPKRYIQLNESRAEKFNESQFASGEVQDPSKRSERQLLVYHNILNILGKRMQANPKSRVTLIGASAGNGDSLGLSYALEVKKYLVDIFEISPSRINTQGRNEPILPSEKPGGKKELELLRAGDRRVDIVTTPDLLTPLQIIAIQPEPIESRIGFNAASGNEVKVKSWTLSITDDKGGIAQQFGPYTNNKTLISGKSILGDRPSGKFNVVMTAEMEDGKTVVKKSRLNLVREDEPEVEGRRFTILFDFDKPTTVDAYKKFITEHVAPLIPQNSTVIIHGHTDIIGDKTHNKALSDQRANGIKTLLETAVLKSGTKGVTYQVHGLGANEELAPFENELPEERLYNRTVIIDIIPAN